MASFSTTQLDALIEAYGNGALTVEYDGKRVTYRSLDELARAITVVAGALGVANPMASTVTRNRIGLVSHTRG
jgi:hypothetical protein